MSASPSARRILHWRLNRWLCIVHWRRQRGRWRSRWEGMRGSHFIWEMHQQNWWISWGMGRGTCIRLIMPILRHRRTSHLLYWEGNFLTGRRMEKHNECCYYILYWYFDEYLLQPVVNTMRIEVVANFVSLFEANDILSKLTCWNG